MILALVGVFLLSSCSDDEGQGGDTNPAASTGAAMMGMHEPGMHPGQGPGMHEGDASLMSPQAGSAAVEGRTQPAEAVAPPVQGDNEIHEVKAAVTRFVPMVLFIKPGDSVHWVNMAGHNSKSIDGLIPAQAESWESTLGEDYTHRFTLPGAYIYKCVPHASLGMEGIIVVGAGRPGNLDSILQSPRNKGMTGRAIRKLKQALDGRDG